jgi:hypothetical protein
MSTPATTSPFGARPKKPRTPPRGWRLLAVGEIVQSGDMVYFRSRWEPVEPHKAGLVIRPWSFPHCRKKGQGGAA